MLKITVSCLYLDSAGQVKEKYLPSLVQVCLASLLCQSFFCVLHLHVITHRLLVASSRALRVLLHVLLRCWVFPPRSWISVSDFEMLHVFVAVLLFLLMHCWWVFIGLSLIFPNSFFFSFSWNTYSRLLCWCFCWSCQARLPPCFLIFPFQSMCNSVCIQPPTFTSLRQELSYSAYTSLNIILKWCSW